MAEIAWPCIYFEKPGKHNTDRVVEAVVQRLAQGDLKTVVVSSTTGYTAFRFAEALEGQDITLISVAEAANNLPDVLLTIADTIEKQVDRMLTLLVRLLEPLLLLVLAGVVVFIFVALVVPMLRMSAAM